MAKGLPKSIIKKYGITKKAWRVFRGKKGKTPSRKTGASNPAKRRTRNLVRKKKRKGGKSLQTTVFKWLRIGALVAPAAVVAAGTDSPKGKVNHAIELYSGVNVIHSIESGQLQFHADRLAVGWLPFLTTTLLSYGIPKLAGIIRRI